MSSRHPNFNPIYKQFTYPSIETSITDQPRTINPAWEIRGLERIQWSYPLLDHQAHTEMKFAHNINSRQDEKDAFRKKCGM